MSSEAPRGSDVALVARAVTRLGRRLRVEATQAALSGGALGLLTALYRIGPMSGVALAREEGLKPQSLSRLLAMLERRGMIARGPDPADRRHLVAAITAEGRAALRDAMEARRVWLAEALSARLSPQERATVIEAAELMLRIAR